MREKLTDLAIAESSIEELKGGRRFNIALKAANLEARKTLWQKIIISSTGEARLDFLHPSIESRIRKIEHVLQQKKLEIDEQEELKKIAKLTNFVVETNLELEKELEEFKTQIRANKFGPDQWKEKTLTEILKLSLQDILKTYSVCFELGILNSKDGQPSFEIMVDRAAATSHSFETLCSNYDPYIFRLMQPIPRSGSVVPALKKVVNEYFSSNCDMLIEGNTTHYNILKDYNLISFEITSIVANFQNAFKNLKYNYEENLRKYNENHESAISSNQKEYQSMMNASPNGMQEYDKLKKNFEDGIQIYRELTNELQSIQDKITAVTYFESTNKTSKQDLELSLSKLDKQILELEKPLPVQGLMAALSTNPLEEDRKLKLEVLKKKRASIKDSIEMFDKLSTIPALKSSLLTKKGELEKQKLTNIALEKAKDEGEKKYYELVRIDNHNKSNAKSKLETKLNQLKLKNDIEIQSMKNTHKNALSILKKDFPITLRNNLR